MLQIQIFYIGKDRDNWIREGIESYEKRMKGRAYLSWQRLRSNEELRRHLQKAPNYYCFDEKGPAYTSQELASFLQSSLRWNFVIGEADGLPKDIKESAKGLISLSLLTFPHEFIRLIFAEQVYRCLEIQKNSAYHK